MVQLYTSFEVTLLCLWMASLITALTAAPWRLLVSITKSLWLLDDDVFFLKFRFPFPTFLLLVCYIQDLSFPIWHLFFSCLVIVDIHLFILSVARIHSSLLLVGGSHSVFLLVGRYPFQVPIGWHHLSGHSEHGDLLLRLWLHNSHHLQTAAGGILVSHSGQSSRSVILVSHPVQSFYSVIRVSNSSP